MTAYTGGMYKILMLRYEMSGGAGVLKYKTVHLGLVSGISVIPRYWASIQAIWKLIETVWSSRRDDCTYRQWRRTFIPDIIRV